MNNLGSRCSDNSDVNVCSWKALETQSGDTQADRELGYLIVNELCREIRILLLRYNELQDHYDDMQRAYSFEHIDKRSYFFLNATLLLCIKSAYDTIPRSETYFR